ncbi:chemotaxis protein CheB [Streptomyces endophyticus]|uniref:protein-glutamate methylesterase n=1 Tax=Streptomyces endophyticus TaxID=714166 RepID=A0ABU6FEW9_9ACTN|nr:chemotaxis protein CheB [Streptomyces endophyticus]MEB8342591.1 chemotaxis protein CheB [Streptomyces endophyticus]
MQESRSLRVEDRCRWAAVLIASSAGGVQGLRTLLGGLPCTLPVPVLVAQHLHRSRETRLVQILARSTPLEVGLAEDGERPRAGTVYIAPPDRHLCVRAGGGLALTREGRVNSARPAADPLFESAAKEFGPRVIACVLTGADGDGARGVEVVKAHGGTTVVQDPATADFHGMPAAAVRTGRADFVLPLEEIAPALTRLLRHGAGTLPGPDRPGA